MICPWCNEEGPCWVGGNETISTYECDYCEAHWMVCITKPGKPFNMGGSETPPKKLPK